MTERPRREPPVAEAPVTLDERGEELASLLPEVLKGFDVEFGAAMDEVVATVKPEDIPAVCRTLKTDPNVNLTYLRCISCVDYEERLEVVYHLFSRDKLYKAVVKTSVSPDEPNVPSVISVWPGADWFEREGHELYGVVFQEHPNLVPLLLYEGFEGYPGRKSFPFHDYDEW